MGLFNPNEVACISGTCNNQGLHWADGESYQYKNGQSTPVKFKNQEKCSHLKEKEITGTSCEQQKLRVLCQINCSSENGKVFIKLVSLIKSEHFFYQRVAKHWKTFPPSFWNTMATFIVIMAK